MLLIKELACIIISLTCASAYGEDLVIEALGSFQQKKSSLIHLSKPEIIPYLAKESDPDSSSWIMEEAQRVSEVNYDLVFQLIKKVFKENHKVNLTSSLKQHFFQFDKDSMREDARTAFEENKRNRVFIYGQSSHATDNHSDLCGFVKVLSFLQDIPSIFWSCGPKVLNSNDQLYLSMLPGAELISKSVLSVLYEYKWRTLAWIRSGVSGSMMKVCEEVEKQIVSDNFFLLEVADTIASIEDGKLINAKHEHFWKKVFSTKVVGTINFL